MERAVPSDGEAFVAVLMVDGRAFHARTGGDVRIGDPAFGPAPSLAIHREREDPSGAATVVVGIDVGQSVWLALSVVTTEYAADGTALEPRTLVTAVLKSSSGEFFVETYVGRLLAAGEYTEYFWTLAGAQLGLDG